MAVAKIAHTLNTMNTVAEPLSTPSSALAKACPLVWERAAACRWPATVGPKTGAGAAVVVASYRLVATPGAVSAGPSAESARMPGANAPTAAPTRASPAEIAIAGPNPSLKA